MLETLLELISKTSFASIEFSIKELEIKQSDYLEDINPFKSKYLIGNAEFNLKKTKKMDNKFCVEYEVTKKN